MVARRFELITTFSEEWRCLAQAIALVESHDHPCGFPKQCVLHVEKQGFAAGCGWREHKYCTVSSGAEDTAFEQRGNFLHGFVKNTFNRCVLNLAVLSKLSKYNRFCTVCSYFIFMRQYLAVIESEENVQLTYPVFHGHGAAQYG